MKEEKMPLEITSKICPLLEKFISEQLCLYLFDWNEYESLMSHFELSRFNIKLK